MKLWALPSGSPTIGVTVRAGVEGAVIPMRRGAVLLGTEPQAGSTMQVRYPATSAALTLKMSALDVLSVAERGTVTLTATVYHLDHIATHTTTIEATDELPDGLVFALVTSDGTYFTAEGLGDEETLTVTTERGSYAVPSPSDSVSFAEGQTARPLRVTALDSEGRETPDLLAGVDVEPDGGDTFTALSEWPLPPYLQGDKPNLGAYLGAFTSALDVRPEQAGRYLRLAESSGEPLTQIGTLYGVSRTDAPNDSDVVRQVQASALPAKDSLTGLTALLHAYGFYGVEVVDMMSVTGGHPLTLDGSWKLDGTYNLDGGTGGLGIQAGEIIAIFRRVPLRGLGRAVDVLRRFKASGIRSRVMLRQRAALPSAQAGVRVRLQSPIVLPIVHIVSPFLHLDGTWNLDGSQQLDGLRR